MIHRQSAFTGAVDRQGPFKVRIQSAAQPESILFRNHFRAIGKGVSEPPAEIYQLKEWWNQINQSEFGSKEYIELCQKVYDFHAQNLFVIGVVGMAPHVYIAKKNIGNVPKEYGPGMSWPVALNVYANQLFFRE